MNWLKPEHIIAVGVALAAIGAIVSGAGTYWNTQRQAQKSEETKNLYKDLLGKSEEIADLNRKLTAANKQVSEILTGGDAFCHVNSIFITENGIPTLKLDIANSGTNPVHNVTIRIRDLVSYFKFFRDNPNVTSPKLINSIEQETMRVYSMGTILPQTKREPIVERNLSSLDHVEYSVEIYQLNGQVRQYLNYVKRNGQWHYYLNGTFSTLDGRQIKLPTTITPHYPKDLIPGEGTPTR